MSTLTREARQTIRDCGLTIAGYIRTWWPDGVWHGDRCGCTDDRCIGYHHDPGEDCGCLPVCIEQAFAPPGALVAGPAERVETSP